MSKKEINKKEAEKRIEGFFKNIKEKIPKQVRKIKRLAMSHNIKLNEKRKLFCQECYSPNLKIITIKNNLKTVKCQNCGKLFRWKLKKD